MRQVLTRWLHRHPSLRVVLSQRKGAARQFNWPTILRNRQIRRKGADDGLPIPPDYLMYLVAGTVGVEWFLTSGRAAADSIRSALKAVDRPWESLEAVLDWGCGCGRVLRHFSGAQKPQLHGCDLNGALVTWSTTAYRDVHFAVNQLTPPLPYPAQSFDLVYSLSVFTHLPEAHQAHWMKELSRILRPRALVILSTQGSHYLSTLSGAEQERFGAGKLVVRDENCAGSNVCMVYHPERFVRTEMAEHHGFNVLLYLPAGAKGNPQQDLYVLELNSRVPSS